MHLKTPPPGPSQNEKDSVGPPRATDPHGIFQNRIFSSWFWDARCHVSHPAGHQDPFFRIFATSLIGTVPASSPMQVRVGLQVAGRPTSNRGLDFKLRAPPIAMAGDMMRKP